MKNVIVTGANGFVGSAVCKSLGESGINVTAVVRSEASDTKRLQNIADIDIVYCDMNNIEQLTDIINGSFDTFYHFAWEGTSGNLRGDENIQLANVKNTCRAVKISRQLGCDKFIFASSIMEYEIEKLFNEGKRPELSTIYCTAKKTANYMAHAIASSLGMTYIAGIISNIYGVGETSPRLINSSIRKMLCWEETSFSPGEQLYDFIYIDDAAKMFAALGETGKNNQPYYIGSGNPRPLKEFLTELGALLAPGKDIGIGRQEFSGISLTYKEFDMHALERDTGVKAEISFEEGIKKTVEWIKTIG